MYVQDVISQHTDHDTGLPICVARAGARRYCGNTLCTHLHTRDCFLSKMWYHTFYTIIFKRKISSSIYIYNKTRKLNSWKIGYQNWHLFKIIKYVKNIVLCFNKKFNNLLISFNIDVCMYIFFYLFFLNLIFLNTSTKLFNKNKNLWHSLWARIKLSNFKNSIEAII